MGGQGNRTDWSDFQKARDEIAKIPGLAPGQADMLASRIRDEIDAETNLVKKEKLAGALVALVNGAVTGASAGGIGGVLSGAISAISSAFK